LQPYHFWLETLTKTDGLLGVTRNVDLVEPRQARVGKAFLDEVGDVGVVSTTTGHVDFVNLPVFRGEAVVVLDNGLRRDACERCDDVFLRAPQPLNLINQFDGFFVAEHFPPRRLRDIMLVPPVIVDVLVNDLLVTSLVREQE